MPANTAPRARRLSFAPRRQQDHIALVVEDRGSGIAAEDLPQVFDPFFRCPEAARRGIAGTGLGLAVARRIVAAMNGALEVQSTSGQGSQFTIFLAAWQPEPPGPQSTSAAAEPREHVPLKSASSL